MTNPTEKWLYGPSTYWFWPRIPTQAEIEQPVAQGLQGGVERDAHLADRHRQRDGERQRDQREDAGADARRPVRPMGGVAQGAALS